MIKFEFIKNKIDQIIKCLLFDLKNFSQLLIENLFISNFYT